MLLYQDEPFINQMGEGEGYGETAPPPPVPNMITLFNVFFQIMFSFIFRFQTSDMMGHVFHMSVLFFFCSCFCLSSTQRFIPGCPTHALEEVCDCHSISMSLLTVECDGNNSLFNLSIFQG